MCRDFEKKITFTLSFLTFHYCQSIERKLVDNCIDNSFNNLRHISMKKFRTFADPTCLNDEWKNLLHFFSFMITNEESFGCGQKKQNKDVKEIMISIFHIFFTFYRLNDLLTSWQINCAALFSMIAPNTFWGGLWVVIVKGVSNHPKLSHISQPLDHLTGLKSGAVG